MKYFLFPATSSEVSESSQAVNEIAEEHNLGTPGASFMQNKHLRRSRDRQFHNKDGQKLFNARYIC